MLFLDELPEFRRGVLEVMRQPLEDGHVTIAHAAMTVDVSLPVMLTAAMNPCMCGFASDPNHICQCTAHQLQRYRARVSGPLLDRIDIHVEVPPVRYAELTDTTPDEPSAPIRQRVNAARERQQSRFAGTPVPHNAAMGVRDIRQHCKLDTAGERLLEQAMQHFELRARAHDRIRKVARTIADLDGAATITTTHLSEAIQYRTLDRKQ